MDMAVASGMALALVAATVLMHYEGLRLLSARVLRDSGLRRSDMLVAIFGVIALHLLEIVVYGAGYWFADTTLGLGSFGGAREAGLIDYFHFSAETFTTLGLGDIYPLEGLRLLASVEAINGLLLIGWSTSFTFIAMQRLWRGAD